MVKIKEQTSKKTKTHPSELVKPIIPLARQEKDEHDA